MLQAKFYENEDVVQVAQQLLGQVLVCNLNGSYSAGIITETEAYHQSEKACHAYNGRRTKRTEPLFAKGGSCYVYLCYGIHHLFNVITGPEEEAAAVLIRAIQPTAGIDQMLQRRNFQKLSPGLTAGPGRLTQAMGISIAHNKKPLESTSGIWIESSGSGFISSHARVQTVRIGVDYAEEDAKLPWRFYLKQSPWISKT